MDIRTKNILKGYIIPYIESVTSKIGKKDKIFTCPICKNEKKSASIYPVNSGRMVCYRPSCNFNGDIFDLVRHCEGMEKWSDYDVKKYLTKLFDIKFPEDNCIKYFDIYTENGCFLFPLSSGSKIPIKDFSWKEDCTDNRSVWQDWYERGWGHGLVLGKKSGIIALDIDDEKTLEKIKPLLNETLTQTTKRGKHFCYKYDEEFDFLNHANLRNKKDKNGEPYEMEIRANNAYIVVAPTSVEGELREWNDKPIVPMNDKLKKFLMELIDKTESNNEDDKIQEAIDSEKIVNLSGKRNDTFVQTAGVFSKWVDRETNFKILNFLSNNWIDKPIPKHELNASLDQITKYRRFDKEEFANLVLERLKIIKEATAFQIAGSLKKDIKDVEDILSYLENQHKIIDLGNRRYKMLNNVEWTTDISNLSVPIDFEMPYFHKYSYFSKKNMVIIAARPGTGKTHITGNLLRKFIEQGINPDLITTEQDGNIGKVTDLLKIPPNSYAIPKEPVSHPTDIELRDNKVTIIDWLKPMKGDYSKTEITFEHFRNQLDRHNGFLIIMSQLRKSNNDYFASDLFEQYGAFVCKYLLTEKDGLVDNINTYFEVTKCRDTKIGKQHMIIPTKYDPDTKTIELRK